MAKESHAGECRCSCIAREQSKYSQSSKIWNSRLRGRRVTFSILVVIALVGSAWYANSSLAINWPATSSSAVNRTAAQEEPINVAAAENGGVATASSIFNENYPPNSVINGDRKGLNWSAGGGWRDGTPNEFPDWIQVDFAASATINEINVVTLQDAWWNPIEPTLSTVFFNTGIRKFDVEYWNGNSWAVIPGGSVINNNRVWRQFTFPNITTDKIRVMVHAVAPANSNSMVVEVEALGVLIPPDPTPTPTPEPTPPTGIALELSTVDIHIDPFKNVGFGTTNPIFNDDGVTGANVGKWVAIDGGTTGFAAYLGLGGTVPNPGDRVGVLNFYNWAMGGVDHRTAAIYSFNGPTLGTGNLEFYTSPNFIGPVRRMQIAPTGEVGINHNAGVGTMLSVQSKSTDASTKGLVITNSIDTPVFTVRSDGQISTDRPGQGIVLKSPNGLVCRKLTIDNSGELVVQPMGTCP